MSKDIEILMMDGCTKSEALKHLEHGTIVFEDFEEHFSDYMSEWCVSDDELESFEKMINEKIPALDWSIVDFEGKTYYIQYSL